MEISHPAPQASRLVRLAEHPITRIAVPLVVLCFAGFVLHALAAEVRWSEVKADIAASTWRTLGLAFLCTLLSFAALALYDILAVRSVARGRVPDWVAGAAGASGSAISNLLGFSYLTGTAVRYRIYASMGLDLSRVAAVIATAWMGMWLGLVFILAILLTLHPRGLSTVLPLDDTAETAIGITLALGLFALVIWLALGARRVTVAGFACDLPGPKLACGLTLAGVLDLGGAALVLYVLMPADLVQSLPFFFVIYIGAVALGILSHSPGGLGVFEATMIAGLGAAGRSDVLAALLLYRVVYNVVPFLIAVACLAVAWAISERRTVTESAGWVYRLVSSIVPFATATLSLMVGALLLVSGNLPADTARISVLRDVLPLSVIEASHMVASVVGVLLIVIARGLYRKLYRAWLIAILLMAVGVAAALLRGFDWEEALALSAAIALLGLFRSAFYRVESASVFRLNGTWIVSLVTLFLAITWVGFVAYGHVEYRDDLWWDFAWHGNASRFLRASLVVAIVLAGIALDSILQNRAPPPASQPIPDVVRRLVAESDDTEANINLTGDKFFLVDDDGKAFIAYGDTGKSLISKGEPVGEDAACRRLIWQLREKADREGKRCAFYAVSPRYLPTYLDLGLSILKIGEVARVDLDGFTLNGSGKKRFRQARNRAARDGYSFEIIARHALAGVLPDLHRVSDKWLATKQGEEKGFSLGGFEEGYLSNFDHAVLRAPDGGIVAFANLFQGGGKQELSLDLMRYDPDAPGFVMDALFAEMMVWGADQGFHWFSLGAAPFSGIENHRLASVWNRVGGFVYAHGEKFYHFEGLRSFKQKFDPVWTPNYLASPGGLAAPKILYEVNVLVSGGIRGLMK